MRKSHWLGWFVVGGQAARIMDGLLAAEWPWLVADVAVLLVVVLIWWAWATFRVERRP